MAQSLSANYIHFIFHIKTTSVAIQEHDQAKLNVYVMGAIRNMGSIPIQVNGVRDHLHILVRLSATMSLSEFVEQVKISSSKFIKTLAPMYKYFSWQSGYGAFSVSPDKVEAALRYIAHQQEHHRDKDFSREYLTFLRGYKLDFNQQYLFKD